VTAKRFRLYGLRVFSRKWSAMKSANLVARQYSWLGNTRQDGELGLDGMDVRELNLAMNHDVRSGIAKTGSSPPRAQCDFVNLIVVARPL
jgi:hypothetical protein